MRDGDPNYLSFTYTPAVDCKIFIYLQAALYDFNKDGNIYLRIFENNTSYSIAWIPCYVNNGEAEGYHLSGLMELTADTAYDFYGEIYQVTAGLETTIHRARDRTHMTYQVVRKS